jgi:enoyl-CoA hydratase/carnithine racemase
MVADFTVTLDRIEGNKIAQLRFQSPHEMNMMNAAMVKQMGEALDEVRADPAIRVLILSGGPVNFTAGADVDDLGAIGDDDFLEYIKAEFSVLDALEQLPKVTIASIRGLWLGNGAEFALACDVRIATRDSRFGLPEIRLGFLGPAHRLSRYVGIGTAKSILYTGRVVKADEAAALGLVTEVVSDEDLDQSTMKLAEKYARVSPLGLASTKPHLASVYRLSDMPQDEMLAGALSAFRSDEVRDALAKFREAK